MYESVLLITGKYPDASEHTICIRSPSFKIMKCVYDTIIYIFIHFIHNPFVSLHKVVYDMVPYFHNISVRATGEVVRESSERSWSDVGLVELVWVIKSVRAVLGLGYGSGFGLAVGFGP